MAYITILRLARAFHMARAHGEGIDLQRRQAHAVHVGERDGAHPEERGPPADEIDGDAERLGELKVGVVGTAGTRQLGRRAVRIAVAVGVAAHAKAVDAQVNGASAVYYYYLSCRRVVVTSESSASRYSGKTS